MKPNARMFLAASFLSLLGDTVVVFAIPVGLGVETGDVRSAVFMWLVPAIAMFLASRIKARFRDRPDRARTDYVKLLFGLAILELLVGIAAYFVSTNVATIALMCSFVFLYAFAKEGVTRLLFVVSVYRYFVDDKEYASIAAKYQVVTILAGLVGAGAASYLVSRSSWRHALVFDALTFVLLGLAILFFGKDPAVTPTSPESTLDRLSKDRSLRLIGIAVPVIYGISALAYNYAPILLTRFSNREASIGILAVGILRLPGIVLGLNYKHLARWVSPESLIAGLPLAFTVLSGVFAADPGLASFSAMVIAQGILTGCYWPADYTVRNRLAHVVLVEFNSTVLARMAVVQFCTCLIALCTYSFADLHRTLIPALALVAASSLAITFAKSKQSGV